MKTKIIKNELPPRFRSWTQFFEEFIENNNVRFFDENEILRYCVRTNENEQVEYVYNLIWIKSKCFDEMTHDIEFIKPSTASKVLNTISESYYMSEFIMNDEFRKIQKILQRNSKKD